MSNFITPDIHTNNDLALLLATEEGHLEVVKFLVENGANIHADNYGALRVASQNGHLEVVKFLVERGADPSVLDRSDPKP